MAETEFAPIGALVGGAMIGVASVVLMAAKGRIAGISGIAVRLFPPYGDGELLGRVAFVAGIVAAPLIWLIATGALPVQTVEAASGLLILAGVLVGFGSVWGNGCTSGHGVCGLSRLSKRSFVAVAVFMATAAVTVFAMRHVVGG